MTTIADEIAEAKKKIAYCLNQGHLERDKDGTLFWETEIDEIINKLLADSGAKDKRIVELEDELKIFKKHFGLPDGLTMATFGGCGCGFNVMVFNGKEWVCGNCGAPVKESRQKNKGKEGK